MTLKALRASRSWPKRTDLRRHLISWLDENLLDAKSLAQLGKKDYVDFLAVLEQLEAIFARAKKEVSPEDSAASSSSAAGPPATRPRFTGPSEIGPPELADQVPEFPYWDEMPRLGKKRLPEYRHVPQKGMLSLDKISIGDFTRGKSGSAFAGLIQIATRTGESADRLFLIPLYQDDAELLSIKFHRQRVSYGTTGQKLLSPHASALQQLIKERSLQRKPWNGFDQNVLSAEQTHHEAGCFLGFFLVKGETPDAASAYVNFTCASLNRYATGIYQQPAELKQAGGPELPLSFALRVHGVLSKLA